MILFLIVIRVYIAILKKWTLFIVFEKVNIA